MSENQRKAISSSGTTVMRNTVRAMEERVKEIKGIFHDITRTETRNKIVETQQRIDALTRSIVNKILHSPTARLREEANGPNAVDYADIARGLFGFD